jgi:energy-coupling factor transporter transmembrane protein EcfT
MEEKVTKKDWFRFFSPAILGIAFSIIGIIISYADMENSGGWSFLGVIILAPVVAILLTLDFIAKAVFRDKTLFIWLVELLILGLIYTFWISKSV